MRCLNRNKRTFYYCLYRGNEYVGSDLRVTYEAPVKVQMSVSASTSMTSASRGAFSDIADYGVVLAYDHRIVTDDLNCPLSETSVLIMNKEPEYDSETHLVNYNYEVIKKVVGLDNITYYIKEVGQ